jgi:hypothetical protein
MAVRDDLADYDAAFKRYMHETTCFFDRAEYLVKYITSFSLCDKVRLWNCRNNLQMNAVIHGLLLKYPLLAKPYGLALHPCSAQYHASDFSEGWCERSRQKYRTLLETAFRERWSRNLPEVIRELFEDITAFRTERFQHRDAVLAKYEKAETFCPFIEEAVAVTFTDPCLGLYPLHTSTDPLSNLGFFVDGGLLPQ